MPIFHLVREVNCKRYIAFSSAPWQCKLIRDEKQPRIHTLIDKFLLYDIALSQYYRVGGEEYLRWTWAEPTMPTVSCTLSKHEIKKEQDLFCTRHPGWVTAGHTEFIDGELDGTTPMPKYDEVD